MTVALTHQTTHSKSYRFQRQDFPLLRLHYHSRNRRPSLSSRPSKNRPFKSKLTYQWRSMGKIPFLGSVDSGWGELQLGNAILTIL